MQNRRSLRFLENAARDICLRRKLRANIRFDFPFTLSFLLILLPSVIQGFVLVCNDGEAYESR